MKSEYIKEVERIGLELTDLLVKADNNNVEPEVITEILDKILLAIDISMMNLMWTPKNLVINAVKKAAHDYKNSPTYELQKLAVQVHVAQLFAEMQNEK